MDSGSLKRTTHISDLNTHHSSIPINFKFKYNNNYKLQVHKCLDTGIKFKISKSSFRVASDKVLFERLVCRLLIWSFRHLISF